VPATDDVRGGDGQRDATAITVLAVVLTLGTGATDVASFTRLGGVFASVMTGNLVLLGLAVGRLSGALAMRAVVTCAGYMAGVAAGARMVPAGQAPAAPWRQALRAALPVEFVLLAGFTVGWELTGAAPRGAAQIVLLVVAAAAMGTQSAAAVSFGAGVDDLPDRHFDQRGGGVGDPRPSREYALARGLAARRPGRRGDSGRGGDRELARLAARDTADRAGPGHRRRTGLGWRPAAAQVASGGRLGGGGPQASGSAGQARASAYGRVRLAPARTAGVRLAPARTAADAASATARTIAAAGVP
jgi:Protein of unknown function (DUF1275)